MTLYRGTYRVESTRHPNWNYGSPGWYFVTICTRDRICFFGRVQNGIMGLSAAGCIVAEEWQRTLQLPPYVVVDAWVIMPNHVHGLIGLGSDKPRNVETPRRGVSTPADTDTRRTLEAHSLGAIIGQIKSVCTKRIRRDVRPDFTWQSRYHDRIVRNEREFRAIRRYIVDNPLKWTQDRLYPENAPPKRPIS